MTIWSAPPRPDVTAGVRGLRDGPGHGRALEHGAWWWRGRTCGCRQSRYRAGSTTVLDVLDAQIRLTQSEVDLVQARYAARLALAGLEAILGRRLFTNKDRTVRPIREVSMSAAGRWARRGAGGMQQGRVRRSAARRGWRRARRRTAGHARRGGRRPHRYGGRRDPRHGPDRGAPVDRAPTGRRGPDRRNSGPRRRLRAPGHAALQGGRRRAQGAGGPGRSGARPGAAVARPHARPARAEGLVPVRARAGRSHGAERRGAARPAQGAARSGPSCARRSPASSASGW